MESLADEIRTELLGCRLYTYYEHCLDEWTTKDVRNLCGKLTKDSDLVYLSTDAEERALNKVKVKEPPAKVPRLDLNDLPTLVPGIDFSTRPTQTPRPVILIDILAGTFSFHT